MTSIDSARPKPDEFCATCGGENKWARRDWDAIQRELARMRDERDRLAAQHGIAQSELRIERKRREQEQAALQRKINRQRRRINQLEGRTEDPA